MNRPEYKTSGNPSRISQNRAAPAAGSTCGGLLCNHAKHIVMKLNALFSSLSFVPSLLFPLSLFLRNKSELKHRAMSNCIKFKGALKPSLLHSPVSVLYSLRNVTLSLKSVSFHFISKIITRELIANIE